MRPVQSRDEELRFVSQLSQESSYLFRESTVILGGVLHTSLLRCGLGLCSLLDQVLLCWLLLCKILDCVDCDSDPRGRVPNGKVS